MNPRELVSAALRGDDLATRRVVKDAKRHAYSWSQAPAPDFADKTDRAVYASLVELLAERNGEAAPAWTRDVAAAPEPVFLMGGTSAVMRRACEANSPDALKRRNVMALPDYLDVL